MNYFLTVLWGCLLSSINGEYLILTATSHNAAATAPPKTHPTLSASILESMPQTATHHIPSPSTTSEVSMCVNTQAMDNDVYPAQALAPGPAGHAIPVPTKSLPTSDIRNMSRTQNV